MITSPAFAGRRYAVLGLARSGLATVAALVASGAEVLAWDNREEARAALPPQVEIDDPLTCDLAGFDGVVVSPGVPLNRHPIAYHAREADVPVIGDIELFAQARAALPEHRVVGITGTNGKSTTTALIHHILVTAGVPATLGGNIGLPILGQDPLPAGGVYVLELSSYQIDLTTSLDCEVAILLNITPDHLDRYDGLAGYAASKARLLVMQSARYVAIADHRTAIRFGIAEVANSPLLTIDSEFPLPGQDEWPALQGPHNAQNAEAASEACRMLGIDEDAIAAGLRAYPGLPHRMERVRSRNGVLWINDSKATNPTSTAPALAAFDHVHWILGGLAKTSDLDACMPHIDHVRAAYTIGEAAPLFARLLAGLVPVTQSGLLAKAVIDAAAAARPGEAVLLSPACASFDQFSDFEARGAAFRAAVEAL